MTPSHNSNSLPFLGFGLGLRTVHYQDILNTKPPIDWLEIITEDFLVPGGRPLYYLHKIRELYPMAMHGVSLSIGSADPVNYDYLDKVKLLAQDIQPAWISDHFCWTGVNGLNMHDLLPLPYTEEALNHVVDKVKQVQDYLGRQILLENVSSYVTFKDSEMSEWEFLTEVTKRADCFILLDVNNVYVSSFNHGFDPQEYLRGVPAKRIKQFHLAGHKNMGDHIVDTHDETIIKEVWNLYADAVRLFGDVSLLIERDDNIPPLVELLKELNEAKSIAQRVKSEMLVNV